MIFETVLWAGHKCEVIAEDTEAGLIKVRRLDGTEEDSNQRDTRYAGIWLTKESVKRIENE